MEQRKENSNENIERQLPNEDDYRLTALKTSYGTGTRSFNRSAEKKEMDKQRKRLTDSYKLAVRPMVTVGPVCDCRSFQYPHLVGDHKLLRSDYDWRTWQQRHSR